MRKNLFVTLEGVDGAGKSSHIQFLVDYFNQLGHEVVLTREPGGPDLSEKLRDLLLHEPMSVDTEVLLMFAARQENIRACIEPALQEGKTVICDRFTDSTFAYQGGGRGYPMERLEILADWVHQGLQPDLTILFDLPLNVAKARLSNHTRAGTTDRFEQAGDVFFTKVREMYLSLVKKYPTRFLLVDSTQSIVDIQAKLKVHLDQYTEMHHVS
ncbi:MAG: dTMP kinase [Alcaligenaceae bacterium]|nr:dTMP kinase [Alcaligenaceae bacterium]